jgi:hypothetical protein
MGSPSMKPETKQIDLVWIELGQMSMLKSNGFLLFPILSAYEHCCKLSALLAAF